MTDLLSIEDIAELNKCSLRHARLTFHDARATALTLLARKVDVMVLARISRHSDISLLHRVYYRETAQDIAARL